MPNKDYAAKLLNLEDVIITNVENICRTIIHLGQTGKKHEE